MENLLRLVKCGDVHPDPIGTAILVDRLKVLLLELKVLEVGLTPVSSVTQLRCEATHFDTGRGN